MQHWQFCFWFCLSVYHTTFLLSFMVFSPGSSHFQPGLFLFLKLLSNTGRDTVILVITLVHLKTLCLGIPQDSKCSWFSPFSVDMEYASWRLQNQRCLVVSQESLFYKQKLKTFYIRKIGNSEATSQQKQENLGIPALLALEKKGL